jgi:hypothetical protein
MARYLNAKAKPLAFRVHLTIAAFFLDCQRGQITNNQQRNNSHPTDYDVHKNVLHNLTIPSKASIGPTEAGDSGARVSAR